MFHVTLTGKESFSIDGYSTFINGIKREVDEETFRDLERTFPNTFSFEGKQVEKVEPKKPTTPKKRKTKVEEGS